MTLSKTNREPEGEPLFAHAVDKSFPWVLFSVLAIWIFLVWYADFQFKAPLPLPAESSPGQFAAARAEPILHMVAGDPLPRNAGSQQNEVVRNRIVEFLSSLGFEVQVQAGEGTVNPLVQDRSPDQDVVPLANIVTRLKGRESKPALLLAAHYDSVPFGPGASDNGVGCAVVLEIARLLAAEPTPSRDVIFLLTDGEELGMLGASLFVQQHEWAEDVGVAINLEARGTSGPSIMFETGSDSRWLVPIFARVSRKPVSSSLFFEIYQRLPNDTDFTIFSEAGMQGFNFAFIGDVANYHTSDDNLANANRGSLQHHGENALSLIRELFAIEISERPAGRAVYFDLFGWKLFWWPEKWTLGLICVAIFMFVGFLFLDRQINRDQESTNLAPKAFELVVDCTLIFSSALLVLFLGWILVKLCSFDSRLQTLWPENPVPYAVAYWLAAFALLCFLSMTLLGHRSQKNVTVSTLALWLVLGLATSTNLVGISHLFIVPILGITTLGLILSWTNSKWKWISFLFPVLVGVMWLSLERVLYDGVGFNMQELMLIRVAVVTSSLLPAMKITSKEWLYKLSLVGTVAAVTAFTLAILLNPVEKIEAVAVFIP